MATDENNHKNEARDDWTGCTFRVERGPSSEGRAWGMADILTDVLHLISPSRVSFPLLPSAHKESAVESDHVFQFAVFRE